LREDNVRKIWSDAELDSALSDLHSDVGEDDGLAFVRASLLAATGTAEEAAPATRRRGTWRWIAVAAAVVTLVGGLGIVVSLRPPAPEPAQPAATLQDIDRPLAAGEFHYARKTGWVPRVVYGLPAKLQQSVELWIPADPTGVWHRRTRWTGGVSGLDDTTRQKIRIDLTPLDEYGSGGVFPGQPPVNWVTPDAAFVASLTADRAQLAKDLMRDLRTPAGSPAAQGLMMARSVFALGLLRKDVRVALRDVISALPGVFAKPSQTSDGRPATVVVSKETGERLYFDPSTAQLLAATDSSVATAPRTTSQAPPRSDATPSTTVTMNSEIPVVPPLPDNWGEPGVVYSYAITKTSG
jgi:hypothetical protein